MPRFSAILRAISLLVLTLSIVGVAAGPRATVSATGARKLTLWLDWYPTTDHAGIYVALAKGFYAREGLDVSARIPSGAADATQLLAHGTGDIGISYEPTVLLARAQGIPIVATAAIVQRPLNAVLSLAGSGIVRPRQLEGRTVGLAGDPSDYTDLKAVVGYDGGDYAKVKKVVVNYALLQGLLAKKVDAIIGAYWSWEALQADQGGHPVNVMRLERFGVPSYNELVFVAGRGQLAREPATLRAFQRATFKGYAYAAAHQEEATSILLKVPGVLSSSRVLIRQSLSLVAPLFKDAKGRYGAMDGVRWQAYADWMLAKGLIHSHLDAGRALTLALLPRR